MMIIFYREYGDFIGIKVLLQVLISGLATKFFS